MNVGNVRVFLLRMRVKHNKVIGCGECVDFFSGFTVNCLGTHARGEISKWLCISLAYSYLYVYRRLGTHARGE